MISLKNKRRRKSKKLKNEHNWDETDVSISHLVEEDGEHALKPSRSEQQLHDDWEWGPAVDSSETTYFHNEIVDEFVNQDSREATEIESETSTNIVDEFLSESFLENSEVISLSEESDSGTPRKKKKINVVKTETNESSTGAKLHLHHTNGGIILALDEDQTVHFYGMMTLSVLHGEVEVLGHRLTKNSQEADIFSPRGTSLLYLQNTTKCKVAVARYLLDSTFFDKTPLSDKCAIVFCRRLQNLNVFFIEKHISQQIFPSHSHLVFEPQGNLNYLKINDSWSDALNKIDDKTKMMICGGKSVGKTTFLRYAINKLLLRFSKVTVIDLDPGQAEFTPPGCISIVVIEKPLLGVNYTHLQTPEKSICASINVSYDPGKYIESVKSLLLSPIEATPILVNYMGYTHGMGINIVSAVIQIVAPTYVVQISSRISKNNYRHPLYPDMVRKYSELFLPHNSASLEYELCQLESGADHIGGGWVAEPRQLREMCILSYFSKAVQSNSIFKLKSPLFKIRLSHIKITDLEGDDVNPTAVNAGLVALCSLYDQGKRIFQCYGWGIVRGIDLTENYLVLLTPEAPQVLDKVNYLVSNGVTLPPSIYMTPDKIVGHVPYVIEGCLTSLGQIPKRSRLAPNKAD